MPEIELLDISNHVERHKNTLPMSFSAAC